MSLRVYGFWGYGPLLPGRFAEFVYASQGRKPETATSYLPYPFSYVPVYKMLRFRYVIQRAGPGAESRRIPQLDAARDAHHGSIRLRAAGKQYSRDAEAVRSIRRRKVILESPPDPAPAASSPNRGRRE